MQLARLGQRVVHGELARWWHRRVKQRCGHQYRFAEPAHRRRRVEVASPTHQRLRGGPHGVGAPPLRCRRSPGSGAADGFRTSAPPAARSRIGRPRTAPGHRVRHRSSPRSTRSAAPDHPAPGRVPAAPTPPHHSSATHSPMTYVSREAIPCNTCSAETHGTEGIKLRSAMPRTARTAGSPPTSAAAAAAVRHSPPDRGLRSRAR